MGDDELMWSVGSRRWRHAYAYSNINVKQLGLDS